MRKSRKILACVLACCAVFSCFAFSGCLMRDFVVSCRGMIEAQKKEDAERRARLDGIEREANYPYVLVSDNTATLVDENGNRTDASFSSVAKGLKKSDLDNSAATCFYRTDEKAYCLYTYEQYEKKEQYTDANGFLMNKSTFTYDVILFEYTYLSGESRILYDFKKVLKSENESMCAFIDDTHILLNDKDGKKVLDLTTMEVAVAAADVEIKAEDSFGGERVRQNIAPPYWDFNLYTIGGVAYYQRLGSAEFYTKAGELALTFDEAFFKERSAAYEKLCTYYDGNEEDGITRYAPEAQGFFLIDGRFFIECRAKYPALMTYVTSPAFVFEYDFTTDELQYVGYADGWSSIKRIVLL